MDRFLACFSPGLAFIALALLVWQWGTSSASKHSTLATATELEPPPLNSALAARELSEIRERHGSILAGTSLETGSQPQREFNAALATYLGESAQETETQSTAETNPLINQLRATAQALDQEADKLENSERYQEADELRALATQLRERARKL